MVSFYILSAAKSIVIQILLRVSIKCTFSAIAAMPHDDYFWQLATLIPKVFAQSTDLAPMGLIRM